MTIPVESSMKVFVKSLGGELVEELLPTANPPLQADYLFRQPLVATELKCLETDWFSQAPYNESLGTLVKKWAGKGLIPSSGTVTLELQTVPEECQREWLDLLNKPVHRILRRANRQIKQTKLELDLPSAQGVLLLVNESVALPPQELMNLIHRVLRSCKQDKITPIFSSLHWVVLFSVNRPMRLKTSQRETHYWLPVYRDVCDASVQDFLRLFRESWFIHFGKLVGLPIEKEHLGKFDLDAITV
jgi:hypothetical protein